VRVARPAVLEVDLGPGIRAGFTVARHGERPPNLSVTVGDLDEALANRAGLQEWLGAPLAFVYQVHGSEVYVATEPTGEVRPVADAIVTSQPQVALAVLVADCVPVLLADPAAGVVAVVHAGRRGVAAGVVAETVAAMVGLGAVRERLRAVVGPAICGSCYEVPAAMRDEIVAQVPAAASTTTWGTPALDLPGAVLDQLGAVGVGIIERVGGCTLEDRRWFSHRGAATGRPVGRLAAVIRVLDPVLA
jgi:YfiH family protein